jgi:hypothetical protein
MLVAVCGPVWVEVVIHAQQHRHLRSGQLSDEGVTDLLLLVAASLTSHVQICPAVG